MRSSRILRIIAGNNWPAANSNSFAPGHEFLDPHTVKLSNGKTLTAAHFIITTGSAVAPPPLPQLRVGCLTSDDALILKRLPKSLIVLGGGAIACEFAQFFARFGVKVTLIQRSEHILREFDTDAAVEIEKVFRREGIGVFTNTKLTDAKRNGKLKTVSFQREGKTDFGFRRGNLIRAGPRAEHGVAQPGWSRGASERGRIVANEFMQTSAPHIYAAGDCTGPHEIVHLAVQQGEIAAHNIAQPRRRERWITGC
jgi:pyruvate/2-oxoglutarate dehydrogenase complex dihydrolipoamide dehydrogenase (E3) component